MKKFEEYINPLNPKKEDTNKDTANAANALFEEYFTSNLNEPEQTISLNEQTQYAVRLDEQAEIEFIKEVVKDFTKGEKGDRGDATVAINLKGSVNESKELPSTANPSDAYYVVNTRDVWFWESNTNSWENIGPIVGPRGDKGERGEKGDRGDRGDKGERGDVGPQGKQGERGFQGPKGDRGEKGNEGPQGKRGFQGEQGIQGLKGDRGEKGEKGDIGPQGEQGIPGPQGERGEKGDVGPQGPPGPPADATPLTERFTKLSEDINKRVNRIASDFNAFGGGGGSGSYWLNDLGDTDYDSIINATNQQVLTFNSATGKWIAADPTGGGGSGTDEYARNTANAAFAVANSSANTNLTQNTNISYAWNHANAAYNYANTLISSDTFARNQANAAFIVANSAAIQANTPDYVANSAAIYANGAFAQSNIALTQANAAFITANSAGIYANGAFVAANSAGVYANGAFAQSNIALTQANAAFITANSGSIYANGAFVAANSAGVYANGAFAQSNIALTQANAAFLQANTPSYVANSAATYANGAFIRANNSLDANNGGTITADVTITKNLYVGNVYITGQTFSVSASTLVANDTLIILGEGNYTGDTRDLGFAGHYNDGVNAHSGLIRDFGTKQWYLFKGYTPEVGSNNQIDINDASFTIDTLNANIRATTVSSKGIDLLVRTNTIFDSVNAAFLQANTPSYVANSAAIYANGAFAQSNIALTQANAAFLQANIVTTYAQSGFAVANSASIYANGAFIVANSAGVYANGAFAQSNIALTQANAAFAQANIVFIQANAAFLQANTPSYVANSAAIYANGAFAQSNIALTQANAAFLQANTPSYIANSASIYANGAFAQSNIALTQANAAFLKANTPDYVANSAAIYANGAFIRANNSLNANTGGRVTGDIVSSGILRSEAQGGDEGGQIELSNAVTNSTVTSNIAIDIFRDTIRFFETGGSNRGAFINLAAAAVGVGSNLLAAAGTTIDQTARDSASAAFIRANNSLNANLGGTVTANVVISANLFAANVTSNTYIQFGDGTRQYTANAGSGGAGSDQYARDTANAAFAQSNIALTQANAAFIRANNSLNANVGGTITGNLVISGSNLVVSNGATEVFNVRSWSVGLPATSNSTGTVTILGGVGIRGNVYADGIFDNGIRIITTANAAWAQSNVSLTQANAAFIRANGSLSANVGGNVTGNLVVIGNVTTYNLTTLGSNGSISGVNSLFANSYYANTFYQFPDGTRQYTANAGGGSTDQIARDSAAAAFIRANNSLNANLGGTVTANVIISANLFAANVTSNTYIQFGDGTRQYTANAGSGGAGSDQYARDTANAAFIVANSAAIQANTPDYVANSAAIYANGAFAQSNVALTQANAAFIRANNSLNANVGGTITGNLVISGSNLVVSNGATEIFNVRSFSTSGLPATSNSTGTVTVIGGVGIRGNVYADAIYDGGVEILVQANAAFAQSNIALTQANAAFIVANSAAIQANTPTYVANSAAIYANGAFAQSNIALTQANAAFIRANNSLNANVGGTITGNLVISGSNISVSNSGTEIFNVRSFSTSGLPATSNSTGTVTVIGGVGIRGNVYADNVTSQNITSTQNVSTGNLIVSGVSPGKVRTINFVIDGGGLVITTGNKGNVMVDFAGTIDGWSILGDASGTLTVDVSKATYANFPTFTASGGTSPALSTQQKNQRIGVDWTGFTTVSANDILRFAVSGTPASVTLVTVALRITSTS